MGKTETGEGNCRGSLGITYTDNEKACRSVKKNWSVGFFALFLSYFPIKTYKKKKVTAPGMLWLSGEDESGRSA